MGNEGQDFVFGGMKRACDPAKRSGFSATDLAGEDGNSAEMEGVIKTFPKSGKVRQWVEFRDGDILGEGFFLKGKEVLIGIHGSVLSSPKSFPL